MKLEVAELLMMTSLRCREDMASLIPILREVLSEEEYNNISIEIGSIVYDISENIIEKIFLKYPDLRIRYNFRLEKFGRGYY